QAQHLADRVCSWSDYVALLSDPGTIQTLQASTGVDMPKAQDDKDKPEDEARASLMRKAESDDPVEAARAKRALAAYDEVPEDKDEDEAQAASAAAPAAAAPDSPEASAVAAAGSFAAQLQ